ncbi:MAG TPA: DUF2127 domain-containing protein [Alphaproteobacteria bacterium]|nr:DUF2127 domain-containing protein [Alphaproteobacteria bacterium]
MAGLASKRGNRTMLDMRCFAIENLRELLFRVSVSLKGLDAVLEIIGSTLLWAFGPGSIVNMVAFLTQDELREDPHDPVSNFAVKAATHLSVGTEHFVAFDLLCDGLIKVLLVAALLRHKLWAYPAAMIVFGLFIAYQIYRFTFTHGIGLLVLSGFDVFLIGLIGLEYQALKRRGH